MFDDILKNLHRRHIGGHIPRPSTRPTNFHRNPVDIFTNDPFVGGFVPPWRNRPKEGVFSPNFLDWYVGKERVG